MSRSLDPLGGERFRLEGMLLAGLEHPHLMPLLDSGDDGARVFLVMPLVTGGTLADQIRTGAVRHGQVLRIGTAMADALAHLHGRGIIHRDVKPANILLGRRGDVFLTDLGIAEDLRNPLPTAAGYLVGTAGYLAPEQVSATAVPASDLFALGLSLLEALTGRPPFTGTAMERVAAAAVRPPHIPDSLGPEWHGFLTALTRREPAYRPTAATAAQWLRAGLHTPGRDRPVIDEAATADPARRRTAASADRRPVPGYTAETATSAKWRVQPPWHRSKSALAGQPA